MTSEQPTNPMAQALRFWTESWQNAAGQFANLPFPFPFPAPGAAAAADGEDLEQQARRTFDEWLAGWSTFLEETLQSSEAVAAGGRTLDAQLNIEKPLRERTAARMQYWLEFMNMPSRRDLIRALSQLNDANARLDLLQLQVEQLLDQVAGLTALLRDRQGESHT